MSQFQRRHSFRDPKKFFIIATEGECTEQIYFEAIKPARDAAIQLKVLPARKGQSHPNHVLARLRKYEREAGAGPRDELWLVVTAIHGRKAISMRLPRLRPRGPITISR